MGFSVTAAAAVIGVSIIISLELLLGSIFPLTYDFIESYDDMKNRAIEQIQTDISITNVATPANDTNYDLNITIANTGSMVLKTGDFNIMINGTDQQFTCKKTYLFPENETYFDVYNLPGEGNRRLKIVTDNGISEYHEYTIT